MHCTKKISDRKTVDNQKDQPERTNEKPGPNQNPTTAKNYSKLLFKSLFVILYASTSAAHGVRLICRRKRYLNITTYRIQVDPKSSRIEFESIEICVTPASAAGCNLKEISKIVRGMPQAERMSTSNGRFTSSLQPLGPLWVTRNLPQASPSATTLEQC